jgi:endonuclease VIII
MPEGHTIHRLAEDLNRCFRLEALSVSSPQGRFTDAQKLDGQVFQAASAIGKHLFLQFTHGRVHIHLGLFGKFRRQRGATGPSVRLQLTSAQHRWDLTGPTCCELLDEAGFKKLSERLGADPLAQRNSKSDRKRAFLKVSKSKRPIGALLLDQSILSGLGNVYRAEILFLAKLNPFMRGQALHEQDFERIWNLSKKWLSAGVRANRIVTVDGARAHARRSEVLYVYKQKRCRVCSALVRKETMGARTLYFCPTCQGVPEEDPCAA